MPAIPQPRRPPHILIVLLNNQHSPSSQALAAELHHSEIAPLHLLVALLHDKEGIVRPLLSKLGVDAERIISTAESELKRLPAISSGGQLGLSRELQEVLNAAQKE